MSSLFLVLHLNFHVLLNRGFFFCPFIIFLEELGLCLVGKSYITPEIFQKNLEYNVAEWCFSFNLNSRVILCYNSKIVAGSNVSDF